MKYTLQQDGRSSLMPKRIARSRRRLRRAFTIIEIMVVVTIIGILATLIVARVIGRIGDARRAVAEQKIAVLTQKVVEFYTDCGRYPSAQEGLRALVQAPSDVGKSWRPYVQQKDILDPWGVEFIYRYPGIQNSDFDILSYAEDGAEGGEGEAEDVGNW
jgi:general secretion pathway protein G